jgi:hypothetical protein
MASHFAYIHIFMGRGSFVLERCTDVFDGSFHLAYIDRGRDVAEIISL